MRVLLVTNGLRYGGAERIVEALALALKERGDVVAAVATTRDGPLGDTLRAQGITVKVLGIRSPLDLRVVPAFVRAARRFEPEVIHSHLAVADIVVAMSAPLLPGVGLVTTVHNSGVELGRIKRALWHTALRRFDRILAVGEHVLESLPTGVAAEIVRPSLIELVRPSSRDEARRALGVRAETPLVMAVGRLSEIKGFDVLAEAKPLIKTRGARVLVIGEGPEAPRLRGSGLELLGPKEEAAALLAAADVVVCPSRSEGFPQVPIHAMAASVPVIATRVGGTPEVVIHQHTGILVEREDPRALAEAIDALLQDPERARALGGAGLERLRAEGLTRTEMIERTRAAYETVRAASRRRA